MAGRTGSRGLITQVLIVNGSSLPNGVVSDAAKQLLYADDSFPGLQSLPAVPLALSSGIPVVFQPGGVAAGNQYTDLPTASSILTSLYGLTELQIDLSASFDNYTLTDELSLGPNCTLQGLVKQSNNTIPNIQTSGFNMDAPLEIKDLSLTVQSGTTFNTNPQVLYVSNQSIITTDGSSVLYYVVSGTAYLFLNDNCIFGDGTNVVIDILDHATLYVYVNDFATLSANAIGVSALGYLIIVAGYNATIAQSYHTTGSGIVSISLNTILNGSGSPEGVIYARPGTMYLNSSGGAGTTLYVKEGGGLDNTGWVGK